MAIAQVPNGDAELALDDPRHGTIGFYNNHGCRCPACRRARRDTARERRANGRAA